MASAVIAHVHAMPIPKAGRQSASWRSGSDSPAYRFGKQSIIGSRHAAIAGFARQVIFNPFPLVVS